MWAGPFAWGLLTWKNDRHMAPMADLAFVALAAVAARPIQRLARPYLGRHDAAAASGGALTLAVMGGVTLLGGVWMQERLTQDAPDIRWWYLLDVLSALVLSSSVQALSYQSLKVALLFLSIACACEKAWVSASPRVFAHTALVQRAFSSRVGAQADVMTQWVSRPIRQDPADLAAFSLLVPATDWRTGTVSTRSFGLWSAVLVALWLQLMRRLDVTMARDDGGNLASCAQGQLLAQDHGPLIKVLAQDHDQGQVDEAGALSRHEDASEAGDVPMSLLHDDQLARLHADSHRLPLHASTVSEHVADPEQHRVLPGYGLHQQRAHVCMRDQASKLLESTGPWTGYFGTSTCGFGVGLAVCLTTPCSLDYRLQEATLVYLVPAVVAPVLVRARLKGEWRALWDLDLRGPSCQSVGAAATPLEPLQQDAVEPVQENSQDTAVLPAQGTASGVRAATPE